MDMDMGYYRQTAGDPDSLVGRSRSLAVFSPSKLIIAIELSVVG